MYIFQITGWPEDPDKNEFWPANKKVCPTPALCHAGLQKYSLTSRAWHEFFSFLFQKKSIFANGTLLAVHRGCPTQFCLQGVWSNFATGSRKEVHCCEGDYCNGTLNALPKNRYLAFLLSFVTSMLSTLLWILTISLRFGLFSYVFLPIIISWRE